MADKRYENREIDRMFAELREIITTGFKDTNDSISKLDVKVTYTNGRVRLNEKMIWMLAGGLVVLSFLLSNDVISLAI